MSEILWFALGVGVFLLGAGSYRYAYRVTLYGEQIDAVGSTTPVESVEPADWNVFFTKAVGILSMLAGGAYAGVMLVGILG
jgi:hypothetical protein